MSENCYYERDMTYTVQVNRFILRLIGLWPVQRESRVTNIRHAVVIIVCYLLFIFILTPYILYTLFKLDTFKTRLKMIGTPFFYLMAAVMYSSLALREDQIRRCVRHVQEDWRNVRTAEDRAEMLKNVKDGRYITILVAIFLYCSAITYQIILPLAKGRIVINENITIRPLVRENYFVFFDPQITPAYEIVFSVECLSSVVIYSTTINVCGLSAMFVMHACGQLQVLMRWINNLVEGCQADKYSSIDRKLALIVNHHMRICSFINRVENTLRDVYLVEMIWCTFILCILGFYIITEYEKNDRIAVATYTLLLISFTANIFVLCYIGEMLSEQGRKVNTTSCVTEWYRLPHHKARLLVLVIVMSSNPLKVTAGKLFDLSLTNFGAVVRTSVAYLNLLRTTTV